MATIKPPTKQEMEAIKDSLNLIVNKISGARVLNGGFDKLEREVAHIKQNQEKLFFESEAQKKSSERVEEKLDKIFDPENGIYGKFIKTENMLESLNAKVNSLVNTDGKIETQLDAVERKTADNSKRLYELKKIAGEDNEELKKSITLSNGIWWLVAMATTGIVGAIGKLIWDIFL